MLSIEELTKTVVAFRDDRDWKQFHTPKDCALALMSEATEVADLFLWKSDVELKEFFNDHKEALADEISDVLYWLLLISHDFDVDIKEAWDRKMLQNEAKYPVDKSKGNHKKYTEL